MAENDKNPVVTMATNMGDIRIELNADKAPITTKNFLDYVNEGYYEIKNDEPDKYSKICNLLNLYNFLFSV